ncbi:Protein of unknown function DUF4267 [Penicillium roqueforti FM164]|uniref:Uncharacterized protein n=1 Tax=Penicillium roqueforti (strain FM164) TaxID=1365484 RepID=W6PZJ0_PENRF|nr:Protein of unknown function DUF4267 [Penicillium roqueforti FM164]
MTSKTTLLAWHDNIFLSRLVVLRLIARAIATTFVGFGVNAILRPEHALTFFQFRPPNSVQSGGQAEARQSNVNLWSPRHLHGAAIYVASYFGALNLGWILIAASSVAFADGSVCWT